MSGISLDTINSEAHSIQIIDADGHALDIAVDGSLVVSATDLDIRDLSASQDNVAISDGTDTLAVNADGSINSVVSATDLDIRDLSASQDNVAISDGTDSLEINADGSINSVVTATDLDIRDLSASQDNVAISDGTDTLAVNADGSINVVADIDDTSNTSWQVAGVTVTNAATQIATTPLSGRKEITIQNLGSQDIYIADTNAVSTSDLLVPSKSSATYRWGDNLAIYGITASGTADVRYAESA